MASTITSASSWVLGPGGLPFYTRSWAPSIKPVARIVALHGFIEHIDRYDSYFSILASSYGIHITGFDQRSFGKTTRADDNNGVPADLVEKWRGEGKTVNLRKKGNYKTSWHEQLEDIEFFVKREHDQAGPGEKLYLMGHSMGGGLALAFPTRLTAPPSRTTLSLLSGIIASSPLIKLTHPQPGWKIGAGSFAANFGLGGIAVPAPVDLHALSHDPKIAEMQKTDPLCQPVGSLKGLGDMLQGGEALLKSGWSQWPKELPLLVFHGDADAVNSHKASEEFVKKVQTLPGTDATYQGFPGLFHEIHNELPPAPQELAKLVSSWIITHTPDVAESQSLATMRTEGGGEIIGAAVDRAGRVVAAKKGGEGYAGESKL